MRFGHLIDTDGNWEDELSLSVLMTHVAPARMEQCLATLGRDDLGQTSSGVASERLTNRRFPSVLMAPRVARWMSRNGLRMVHAWGRSALRAAHFARRRDDVLVYTCHNPALDARTVAAIRLFCTQGPTAVVCTAQRVLRRLVEQGVPRDRCVVIRPAVDFGRVNAVRKGDLRSRLGLGPQHRAILLAPHTSEGDHAIDAAWAVLVLGLVDERIRLVAPSMGRPMRRVRKLGLTSYQPETLVAAPGNVPVIDLIAISDVLLWPTEADASTTPVAWAMAAGTLVVGAAGYALSELIAHKHNGLLYKRSAETGVVRAIAHCLMEPQDNLRPLMEVARGHAFDVFGRKRFVDQHLRLYDNLLMARSPSDGIVDSAIVA